MRNIGFWSALFLIAFAVTSCEKFMNPKQELEITEDRLYQDWYEYRSVEMGLYGLQQNLVEQLLVLGELRGDLLEITPYADADLVEVYNFNVSKSNTYASPTNFFKLIAACNNFVGILQDRHPEVMDPQSPVTNYDRLYGEVLCMRAWAYFNAVRIYGKVPFIPESLTTIEEIEDFVGSSGTYVDSVHIVFDKDGYHNDTLYNVTFELEKQYYDTDLIIDHFTNELENKIKAVGVNHYSENNDETWEITIWNEYARHALLGKMYLTQGDYRQASRHFRQIIEFNPDNSRYHLDIAFAGGAWPAIFLDLEIKEHIYVIYFNKSFFQQNRFQDLFEAWGPHEYMMKPTYQAILNWESQWRNQVIDMDLNDPEKSEMRFVGVPSDFQRGIGRSYIYVNNGVAITEQQYTDMILLRRDGDDRNSKAIMENMDTVVTKYSIGKDVFDEDAFYIIYRAGGIHLDMAEIYTNWKFYQNDILRPNTAGALGLLNDGSYITTDANRIEMGIRGRVGLGSGYDAIRVSNVMYIHDPFTNEITGYFRLNNLDEKQRYLDMKILEERALETAFEGERFYDLMRVARRWNDPGILAEMVSKTYPPSERNRIYNLLLDENNWYIHYFDE